MLLRGSGEKTGEAFNLAGVTGASDDAIGVPDEALLLELTDAIISRNADDIERLRTAAVETLGAQAALDAIAVASGFNGITKVANATGIPLDDNTAATTVELRVVTGIDDYADAHKATRYS